MTAPELKPCPFCGRGAEFSLGKTGDGKDWHYIECVNCGATGPLVNYADHNIAINDALADAWNRRADLATIEPQPDPRDEVIARLVEALHANVVYAEKIADAVEIDPDETFLRVKVMPGEREVATRSWSEVLSQARAAIAAAKAVQHD